MLVRSDSSCLLELYMGEIAVCDKPGLRSSNCDATVVAERKACAVERVNVEVKVLLYMLPSLSYSPYCAPVLYRTCMVARAHWRLREFVFFPCESLPTVTLLLAEAVCTRHHWSLKHRSPDGATKKLRDPWCAEPVSYPLNQLNGYH